MRVPVRNTLTRSHINKQCPYLEVFYRLYRMIQNVNENISEQAYQYQFYEKMLFIYLFVCYIIYSNNFYTNICPWKHIVHLISALQPLLTGPHDRNRQLNCSCPVTCTSYIWRSDIRVRNVNLLQTEIAFISGAKRHSMKGFLSLQHALHFHLTCSTATVHKL